MVLTSPAFHDSKPIPSRYANRGIRGGSNLSPPLQWTDPPAETNSFALSIVDLHPKAHHWVHWLVVDIPTSTHQLPDGASPSSLPPCARELFNSFGNKGYGGPFPLRGSGIHTYLHTLYALDIQSLTISIYSSLPTFHSIITDHILSSATLRGIYEQ